MASTFSFVDLCGYSAAAWAHGDDVAARLAITLHELAQAVAGPEDRIIKSIGDAVMCRSTHPQASLEWHARLFEAVAAEDELLELRAGCHHGDAVEHKGDYYGTTINVASRVAGLAGSNELLGTAPVAASARDLGWAVASRGAHRLRNIAQPIEVWWIDVPTVCRPTTIDPVCRMRLSPTSAKASHEVDGELYYFCSEQCEAAFLADPGTYIRGDV
jgi:adenylate cyclase